MSASDDPAPHPGRALAMLCAVFFSAGFLMAAIGPVLPALSARTGASLAAIGRLTMVMFIGSFAAQFVAGWGSDRFGRRLVLTAGLLLLAGTGTAIALSTSLALTLAVGVVYGLGYGAFSLSGNVMASELMPARRASSVNLVNMFFGLGAVVGPLIVSVLLERTGASLPALWLGSGLLSIVAVAAAMTLPDRLAAPTSRGATDATAGPTPSLFRDGMLFACGVLLLLYVGSEMAAGFWSTVYLQQSAGMNAARAAAGTSLFWAMLTLGRISAVVAGMRLHAEHLLTASVWIACAGAALLWTGHGSAAASVTAFAVLGFGYGPIYPTGVAVLTSRFPHAAGLATSQMGILAATGGALLPWIHGLVLAHRPSRESALLTLVVTMAMIAVWECTRRLARRAPAH
ncbi:MAG: MFS transporter [Vicinamibacteraceae bacterium]